MDSEPKKYYPDFELQLLGGQVVHVEVKPSIKLSRLELEKNTVQSICTIQLGMSISSY